MLRQAVAVTCCLVGQALADPLYAAAASKLDEDLGPAVDPAEGRLFFTSNGGFSLTNSTIDLGKDTRSLDIPFNIFIYAAQEKFRFFEYSAQKFREKNSRNLLFSRELLKYALQDVPRKWPQAYQCRVYVRLHSACVRLQIIVKNPINKSRSRRLPVADINSVIILLVKDIQ